MPHTRFVRSDFKVAIARRDDGIELSIGDRSTITDGQDVLAALRRIDFGDLLRDWNAALPAAPLPAMDPLDQRLRRIALEIAGVELHAIPWEQHLRGEAGGSIDEVVRVFRVAPRVAGATLALPLRVLVLDAPELDVAGAIANVFGGRPAAERDRAIVASHETSLVLLAKPESWPTVDILHFGRPPSISGGTLVSISRATTKWHTRLVVFDVRDEGDAEEVRQVGARLAGRGGPAVILRRVTSFVGLLYERLIHDFPLDALSIGLDTIFGGQGREELVRVSTLGAELVDTIERAKKWDRGYVEFVKPEYRRLRFVSWNNVANIIRAPAPPPIRPLRTITDTARHDDLIANLGAVSSDAKLDSFLSDSQTWQYSLHEGEGVLPMIASVDEVCSIASAKAAPEGKETDEPRYVNASLWSEGKEAVAKVDAASERLTIGDPYQLRIQIGDKDKDVPVYLTSALFDDRLDWKPSEKGRWVEVGVTGASFRIEGEAVQELWLPRFGESEPIYFAVTPMTATPVLRYTIYCDGNILQTFRLAALADGEATREQLAAVLDIAHEELPEGTYVTRLDFAGANVNEAECLPRRALSLVANHADGERS